MHSNGVLNVSELGHELLFLLLNHNMRVPTEYEEQVALVQYLNLMGIKHTSIPNSTFTTSWGQKMKNKKMGLHK